MGLVEIVILAVVQGTTEFLPISSSAHLRAAAEILGIPGRTLVIDVAVHVGTLFAVVIYFWRDLARIFAGMLQLASGRMNDGARLGLFVAVATVPVFLAGYFGRDLIDAQLRTLLMLDSHADPAKLVSVLHYNGISLNAGFVVKRVLEEHAKGQAA